MDEDSETKGSGFGHLPVMPQEVLEWLSPQPGQTVLDGTLGLGGHSGLFAEAVGSSGTLVALDRDTRALEIAGEKLKNAPCRVLLKHSRYSDMRKALSDLGIERVDRVFLDIGVSSMQLDAAERGFSFMRPGPLDMRMDQTSGLTAADLIASTPEKELADLIYLYGEERFSRRIAKSIVLARGSGPINTTERLSEIIERAVPGRGRIHPATRTFQALRIAVNDELGELERGLEASLECLAPAGRLAILTFHSLEDRIAKKIMREWSDSGKVTLLKRKTVKPSREECLVNRRSRSAKLRICEIKE